MHSVMQFIIEDQNPLSIKHILVDCNTSLRNAFYLLILLKRLFTK